MGYDTIIVGAGSAGAVLAARLTEDHGRNVLLLEAGPDYPDLTRLPGELKYGPGRLGTPPVGPVSPHRWAFVARFTDQARPRLVPRGRVVGGSSAVNARIFLRGVPEDYDAWAALGNDRWSYRELLPFFRKLETDNDFHDDFHGTEGPIVVERMKEDEWNPDQVTFYNACRAAGLPDCPDHNDPDSTGVGPFPFNGPDGVRWSTAIGYLDEARHRPNLTIRADSVAHRVLFDGSRAAGVAIERDGEVVTEHADEVILSAGAIGSPHLMMLSGIGPAGHLSEMAIPLVRDLPGVGRNLRDHPQVWLTWRTKPDFRQNRFADRLQLTLRYTSTGSRLRNDMLIHPGSYALADRMRGERGPAGPPGFRMVAVLDLAKGAGQLRLRSSDPTIQPWLDYNYLTEQVDRDRLREAVELCHDLAEHPDFGPIIGGLVDPTEDDLSSDSALDAWMAREVRTSHHVSGTCKMGPDSDPVAVVNQYGRVRGVEGLRVVDASIMPDCIRANTNATTIAIGERVADFIRSGL